MHTAQFKGGIAWEEIVPLVDKIVTTPLLKFTLDISQEKTINIWRALY